MNHSILTLRRQLLQLKELHDAGVLPAPQYEESKATLERRLLDLVLASDAAGQVAPGAAGAGNPPGQPPVPERLPRRTLAVLAGLVLAIAGAGYWWMGSPARWGGEPVVQSEPAATSPDPDGQPHPMDADQIAAMTDKLAARLEAQPQDAEGWGMLARSYTVLGRHAEALNAYRRAVALRADHAQLLADYADALAVINDRSLAGEPMKWVDKALKLDPRNLKALSLAGTDAFNRKDYAGAVRHWEQVVAFGPGDSDLVLQAQSSLVQARELGRLAASQAAAAGQPPLAPPGKTVSGTVFLSPALGRQAAPEDTVFIFARAADGRGMPLAILRKKVKDLPLHFTLDDSLSMSPVARLSGATSVVIGARISKTGEAMPQKGDLSGEAGPVNLGATALKVEISKIVAQ
ncbi:c-type cytochrome biogenesis protein CcmI/CycH [Polaromonas jejuensis]|uniref:C-type cytochrome biogenesis protein CcmI n=1 Tax=Polaromonas jejuensis TaxID=457502 RepID=A0ABW0Q6H3_9BURK|nr:hypothetical protein [Polaromonas jejuensis]